MNTTIISAPNHHDPEEHNQDEEDLLLSVKVRLALLRSPYLASEGISVDVRAGRVHLQGPVPDHRHKLKATEIARGVAAPGPIENSLEVVGERFRADNEIRRESRTRLHRSTYVNKRTILVEVAGGRVKLRGNVANPFEAELAADTVLAVPGVQSVTNLLLTDPHGQARDDQRARETQLQFHFNPVLSRAELDIAVANGTAVVTGAVPEARVRPLIDATVQRFCDPVRLRNEVVLQA